MLSHEELIYHSFNVYSQNRKRKSKSFGERPSGPARIPAKAPRTSGLIILKDTMRLEAKSVHSDTAMPFEVTPSGNHGK